jgi:general secretion pathway protein A
MYERHFGFTGRPFQLNPDPSFFFASMQHRRAMAFLDYGLEQAEGFIIVTGEVGAGKTTLVRNMLSRLDPRRIVAAHLVSTQLDADGILRVVAAAFGVTVGARSKAEILIDLEARLLAHTNSGKRCLLLVDEAQNLPERAVEELRMLSNFQVGSHALLQSFLVGQPEFRLMLQGPQMNQLRQRVIAACHVGPLDADETRQYIEHRLKHVGWTGTPRIEPGAFAAAFAASEGIPRRINLVFDRTLLATFLAERPSVTAATVLEVTREIRGETGTAHISRAATESSDGGAAA